MLFMSAINSNYFSRPNAKCTQLDVISCASPPLTHAQELLAHHEGMCTELESQLHECQVHTDALSHTVMELGEANEALRAENTELQTQLMNQRATEEKKTTKAPLSR